MPGFELIDAKERESVLEVFDKSNGVLFAHGFDVRRNNIFRVRDFEKSLLKHYLVKVLLPVHQVPRHSI